MNLELELALKFVRRRSRGLLRGTSLAAASGVALATAAMVVTLALMTGYRGAIAGAMQRGNAHMLAFSPVPLELTEADRLEEKALAVGGVVSATSVAYIPGLLEDPGEPAAPLSVVLKASAEPPSFSGLANWPTADAGIPVLLGYRLAAKIGAREGQTVHVLLPPRRGSWLLPSLPLHVVGTFHVAFSEIDEQWLIAPLEPVLRSVRGAGVTALELRLRDPMAVAELHDTVEAALPELMVTDWYEMNPSLFAALRWQTLSLFVVLSLVAAVASFQVSSALVVVATERRRSMGMLQALGVTPGSVRQILTAVGCLVGFWGIAVGLSFGCLVSFMMTRFRVIHFPPGLARVYMVEFIPLQVTLPNLAAVAAVCAVVVAAASLWPARQAARVDPVAALRAV